MLSMKNLVSTLRRAAFRSLIFLPTKRPSNLPNTDTDQKVVGKMAAKYFFELGYRQCVFFGSASAAFSRQREEAFRHSLDAKKIHFSAAHIDYTLRTPFEDRMKQAEESVRQWLVELPKPIAVFCSNDEHARMLSSLCQIGGIAVPDEVALLGVNNDETMCLLSSPPLSSIDNPGEEIGYRAAAMLNQMKESGDLNPPDTRIEPIRIVERRSTQLFAAEDSLMRKAITFLERNLRHSTLTVDALAGFTGVSGRSSERTFASRLGLTVLVSIHRARILKGLGLLRDSSLSVHLIALECGFSNHWRFGIVLRSFADMTPSAYRKFSEFDKRKRTDAHRSTLDMRQRTQ